MIRGRGLYAQLKAFPSICLEAVAHDVDKGGYMVEGKIDEFLKEWNERPVNVSMTLDGKVIGKEVECPKCRQMHKVDEPGEPKGEFLSCDTHGEKIPFPDTLVDQLNELAKGLTSDSPKEKTSRFVIENSRLAPIGVKFGAVSTCSAGSDDRQ